MSKTVTRFVNSFLSQATRRGLRAAGVPRHFVPFAVGMVRDFNRKMQWGNRAVWSKRVENGKAMYSEFTQWQKKDFSSIQIPGRISHSASASESRDGEG